MVSAKHFISWVLLYSISIFIVFQIFDPASLRLEPINLLISAVIISVLSVIYKMLFYNHKLKINLGLILSVAINFAAIWISTFLIDIFGLSIPYNVVFGAITFESIWQIHHMIRRNNKSNRHNDHKKQHEKQKRRHFDRHTEHTIVFKEEPPIREKLYSNLFLAVFKWISTLIFIYIFVRAAQGKISLALRDSDFGLTIIFIGYFMVTVYLWYKDVSLYRKRRKRGDALFKDALLWEFFFVILIAFLIGYYSMPHQPAAEQKTPTEARLYLEEEGQTLCAEWCRINSDVYQSHSLREDSDNIDCYCQGGRKTMLSAPFDSQPQLI